MRFILCKRSKHEVANHSLHGSGETGESLATSGGGKNGSGDARQELGLARQEECSKCPIGKFCPGGASRPQPCGAASFYCPEPGLPRPVVVEPGHMSTPEAAAEEERTGQAPCKAG